MDERSQLIAADPSFDDRWLGAFIPEDRWHFHRRLYERYAIVLGPGEYSQLIRDLRDGKFDFVKRRHSGTAVIAVKLHRKRVYLIAKGSYIMTVLPHSPQRARQRRAEIEKSAGADQLRT